MAPSRRCYTGRRRPAMHFDALVMCAVRDELSERLRGGRIDKIFQPSDTTLALLIRAAGQNHQLLLSAHPQTARVHLVVASRLTSGFEFPSGFVMLLRKYCEGARILNITQPPHERILRCTLRQSDGTTSRESMLIIEVMGRRSNILLTNPTGTILGLLKRVTPHMSRDRPVQVHDTYRPPPAPPITQGERVGTPKIVPEALDGPTAASVFAGLEPETTLPDALIATVAGVSPTLAREVAHRATGAVRSI